MNMGEFKFYTEARVRFCETDLQGIMHHSEYLKYFEVARVEYMRNLGLIAEHDFLGEATVAVAECGCEYKNTMRFDDLFKICVRVSNISGARIRFEYKVLKSGDDSMAAIGFTEVATLDRKSFKPTRVPETMLSKIRSFEGI